MSYNMTPLVMHCVYPFPKEGIPCPACSHIKKKPSLFNLHAKKVHHTLAPQPPTMCTGCGHECRSYKAASVHYSRAYINGRPTEPRTPSPCSSQTTSLPTSLPQPDTKHQPSTTSPEPRSPPSSLPLSHHQLHSPTRTPEPLSPMESTQELMRNFLHDIAPASPPPWLTSTASTSTPRPPTNPTSCSPHPPAATVLPIPIQSLTSITPCSSIDDFIRTIRHSINDTSS